MANNVNEKFGNDHLTVGQLLNDIENGYIAIPEIQRPFVWSKTQVRDLIDSLYNGYPIGYIVIWKNPNTRLKNGKIADGKKVIIDGQQRITALMAALKNIEIIDENYKKGKIKIAYNPYVALGIEKDSAMFATQTASIANDKKWIPDISEFFSSNVSIFDLQKKYCKNNPSISPEQFEQVYNKLRAISTVDVGQTTLSADLDLDTVTEIFIRLNSKGTVLSTADFAMSRIAADDKYGGKIMRKAIDYFAHMSKDSAFIADLNNDKEFSKSDYMKKVTWLKDLDDDIYKPDYADVLRVAFMFSTKRTKLADLVSMLSGRDFETKEYKEEKAEEAFKLLDGGLQTFMNEWKFKQFLVAIKSAGFINSALISGSGPINFAYALYLLALDSKEFNAGEVNAFVQKWYVLSLLTQRYSKSSESVMSQDLKNISEKGFRKTFGEWENSTISDAFWNSFVPQNLDSSNNNNPSFLVYLAAQVKNNDISLLSHTVKVSDLISTMGDVHHIFPKAYLVKNKFIKKQYNQLANYAYLDTQVNIDISDDSPDVYFAKALKQCDTHICEIGTIKDKEELKNNLLINCVPESIFKYNHSNYETFLEERRKMMAAKIKKYYESL